MKVHGEAEYIAILESLNSTLEQYKRLLGSGEIPPAQLKVLKRRVAELEVLAAVTRIMIDWLKKFAELFRWG